MKNTTRSLAVFISLLVLAALVYWPGLSGPFVLDDLTNLEALFALQGSHTWNEFLNFIFSGFSGPTGRPASLSTFYLNYIASGPDPWFFKFTNLVIHFTNGILVYSLILYLLDSRHNQARNSIAALAAILWLIHPLHVSTTMYVIQRMTQLSSLCVLAGLIHYVHLRKHLNNNSNLDLMKISVSLISFTTLAILFKENGVLLPVYALLIERFFLGNRYPASGTGARSVINILLIAPLLLILLYLAYTGITFNPESSFREFTAYQRLLTESRVLLDYIGQIITPDISVMGIYHDDYVLSASLLSPPQTALAAITIILSGIIAYLVRNHYRILSFAISWYLLGHILEGTVVPLELYFEHRNYLPSIGPIFLLAYGIYTVKLPISRTIRNTLAVVFITVLSSATFLLNKKWGDETVFLQTSYKSHPQSPRANLMVLNHLLQSGNYTDAYIILARLESLQPMAISTSVYELTTDCLAAREVAESEFQHHLNRFAFGIPSNISKTLVNNLVNLGVERKCDSLSQTRLLQILKSSRENHLLRSKEYLAFSREAEAYVLASSEHADVNKITRALDLSIQIEPTIDRLLWRARISAADKNFKAAEKFINQADSLANKRIILNNKDLERIKYDRDTLIPNSEQEHSE